MTYSFHSLGAIQSYEQNKQGLVIHCGESRVTITALTERIIRVRLAPSGNFAARRSWAVTPPDESFLPISIEVTETHEALGLQTSVLSVQIARTPCRIAFQDSQHQPFCVDTHGLGWQADSASPRVVCHKQIEPGEHFYGFGERADQLDQSGRRITNWTTDQHRYGPGTDPLYIAIPVFMALRPGLAYGIFLNNTWRSQFDMGQTQPGVWSLSAEGGELDYYLVYGPTPAQVLSGFAHLLGKTPLPPRWAIGYHQSRYSYASEEQVREVTAEFRRRQIPCDAIHLDIDHMQGYRDFTWEPSRFPDPQRLIADLKRSGFQTVVIADSGVKIDPDYEVYQAGLERDVFIRRSDRELFHGYVWPDDSVFPDYTRPDVRQWWGEMQQRVVEIGVSGIWNDMNEPTVFDLPFSQGGGIPHTIDSDAPQGPEGERTTHAEVHNLYGSGMAQASYEGLRRSLAARPFVLTRSGYAGIQRWSACWTGDNTARWEHLEMSIAQMLNLSLSAVPFAGADIGGFFDNASGELFARWMQFGSLMPFCRSHTHIDTAPHEPWVFGPRVEAICREYLQLRYRWLPYLYSLFWEASQCGVPVLRPLLYEYPDDPVTYSLHDQVLLGPSIMAAPIYQPGREHRVVYLPAGEWYDWWSDEKIIGPTHVLAQAPLERMPIYIRAGAIIPSGPQLNYTNEQVLDPLTLEVYAGEGAFTLYEDDGYSFDYENRNFCLTRYQVQRHNAGLRIQSEARAGLYQPSPRSLVLRIHGVKEHLAERKPEAEFDAARGLMTVQLDDKSQGFLFDL